MFDPALSDTVVVRIDRFRRFLPQLVHAVAEVGGVDPAALVGPGRTQWPAKLRAAIVMAAHDEMGKNWSEIARGLGGRNHAAMIAAYRKAKREWSTDVEFRQVATIALAVARSIVGREPTMEFEPELAL